MRFPDFYLVNDLVFLVRNVLHSRKLGELPPRKIESKGHNIVYRPLDVEMLTSFFRLADTFKDRLNLSMGKRLLCRYLGRKLTFIVIKDPEGARELVGLHIFYFNKRDKIDGTIHEGFIGVHESMRNKQLSSQMRAEAIRHFKTSCLSGISTRISLDNYPSIRSAERSGFEIRQQYLDLHTNTERAYLVCEF